MLSVDPVTAYSSGDMRHFNPYAYANNNPYRFTDPDGRIPVETIWDVANVVMGVTSAYSNFSQGNIGAGMVDVGGVIVDAAATAIPYVPGGAGTAIKAGRAAEGVADTVSATRRQALGNAKDANGVPRSAQPDAVIKPGTPEGNAAGLDSRNVRQYEYTNSNGEKISIREDKPASYSDGGSQPAHFNAGRSGEKLEQHHYFEDKKK